MRCDFFVDDSHNRFWFSNLSWLFRAVFRQRDNQIDDALHLFMSELNSTEHDGFRQFARL